MNAREFWKEVKLKWVDIKSRMKGDFIPRVWKEIKYKHINDYA
jgi:hypothetical protein